MIKVGLIMGTILTSLGALWTDIFYTREVFGHQDFSYGLQHHSRLFFLSSWHRYRKPKGIARFPDGGRVKTVYEEISLFSYCSSRDTLEKHALVANRREPGTDIKGARLKIENGFLYIAYKCNNDVKHPSRMYCLFRYNIPRGKLEKLVADEAVSHANSLLKNYWSANRDQLVPISELKAAYLKDLYKYDWGFPEYSP